MSTKSFRFQAGIVQGVDPLDLPTLFTLGGRLDFGFVVVVGFVVVFVVVGFVVVFLELNPEVLLLP